MVSIVDGNAIKFGKYDNRVEELGARAALPLIEKHNDIDFVIVSNSYSGEFNAVSGINNLITTLISIDRIPSVRVDNTSGSGGSALLLAKGVLAMGFRKVLVIGVEKMRERQTRDVTKTISTLLTEEESKVGFSLPSIAGFVAMEYMRRYSAPRESLAKVAVKNHYNATFNDKAFSGKVLTIDEVLSSKPVIEPLRSYEISPIADGAVALVMVNDQESRSYDKVIYVNSMISYSSSSALGDRGDLTWMESVELASKRAFLESKTHPRDIGVVEVHDMASILEIMELEAAGFFKKGQGWIATMEDLTSLTGVLPVNTSGGLIGKGHPIGATGVAQAYEIWLQLTRQAANRQVEATKGMTINIAGFGNNAIVGVYGVEP
ncbi:acetyl-CoA acetyltransferase [Sulfolobales archaeon HS-7]|nr:acetyl-CoA acetyltransferase [Sulfolobales archaeon HS-7]